MLHHRSGHPQIQPAQPIIPYEFGEVLGGGYEPGAANVSSLLFSFPPPARSHCSATPCLRGGLRLVVALPAKSSQVFRVPPFYQRSWGCKKLQCRISARPRAISVRIRAAPCWARQFTLSGIQLRFRSLRTQQICPQTCVLFARGVPDLRIPGNTCENKKVFR